MKYYLSKAVCWLINWSSSYQLKSKINSCENISKDAFFGLGTVITGEISNIFIGSGTYINRAHLEVGKNSKIVIGEYCAIGYNVSIKARTHDKRKPTNSKNGKLLHLEKDILIGNNCWIGDNVYIREGVKLGDNCIVGANSVVTRSFDDGLVIGGTPARVLTSKC